MSTVTKFSRLLSISLICLIIAGTSYKSFAQSKSKKTALKVLQFNIWQEGTIVSGGFNAIIDEIIRVKVDLITLSEVRNYNGDSLNKRLVEALKAKGYTYYSERSEGSGILSRYPILMQNVIFPLKDDKGSITKAIIQVGQVEVALYSAHLDYRNCSLYLPRGYDGSTWEELPAPITDPKVIAEDNLKSQRDEAIDAFIKDASNEKSKGRVIFLGGDFNEPSHQDWTEATKNLFDHRGVVMQWRNTMELSKNGYIDAFRQQYSNPVTHPGFTFPADNPAVDIKKLAWSPKADDRDRIDYVFYFPDRRLSLKDVKIVGPKGSVVRNERVQETSHDHFDVPSGVWPTDHKAVLATFELKEK